MSKGKSWLFGNFELELLELDLSNLNPHLKQYIQALKKAEYRAYRVFPKLSSNVEISEEIWDRINALRPCQSMALSFYYDSKDGINAGHHVLIYKDSLGYTYFFDSNNQFSITYDPGGLLDLENVIKNQFTINKSKLAYNSFTDLIEF